MKPAIMFLAAFVVGTVGATGAKVMLTKPPAAKPGVAADSARAVADSTHADGVAASEKPAQSTPSDSTHAPAPSADSSKSATVPAIPTVNIKPSLPSPQGAVGAAAPDTTVQSAERRLAKVFTSMEAKQAAKVLEHMTDSDVHVILGYVGPRQAATILAELPPERVAALSKLAMQKPAGVK